MPSFDTPEPISVTAQVYAGSLQLTASDRLDTVVEVRPRDPNREVDVRAAGQTEVTYASGVLTVRTPKGYRLTGGDLLGRTGCVDVTVELPTGSRVETTGPGARLLGEGRLGEVRVQSSAGDVRLETTGPLRLNASHGSIVVDRVEGMAEITSSSGSLRVGTIDGPAVLKNSHGAMTVGAVTGDLQVRGTHGGVDIGRAEASVTATTTHGSMRVAEVARGNVRLETFSGSIEVGIREGTAAWLDVSSERGQVRNSLAAADAPAETEDRVEVRARTTWGNIDVRRARATRSDSTPVV